MFRITKREVLVSISISIDAAALVKPPAPAARRPVGAIIAAPSSVHDRAGIVLDHLGRELPQGLSGVRMHPLPDTIRSVLDSYSTSFAMNCSSVECRARIALMSASWNNLADRRRRNLFFDSIGQTGNAQNKQMLSALPH
jgi:hypothetical protein